MTSSHSTPSGVTREYFATLREVANAACSARTATQQRRLAALAVTQAITTIEVFMNLWVRQLLEEKRDQSLIEQFIKDLGSRLPFSKKLERWPKFFFGKPLDFKKSPALELAELISLRNEIVHFESNYETVEYSQLIVHGLANTTKYDALQAQDAIRAVSIAENIALEFFRLANFNQVDQEQAKTAWTGSKTSGALLPEYLKKHLLR